MKKEVHIIVDERGQLRITWESGMNAMEAITMMDLGIKAVEKKLVNESKVIVPQSLVRVS